MADDNELTKVSPAPGRFSIAALGQTLTGWGAWLGRWGRLALRALQTATAPESQLVASSIGFFTLFSVFPLALLAVALASNWLDPVLAEQRKAERA